MNKITKVLNDQSDLKRQHLAALIDELEIQKYQLIQSIELKSQLTIDKLDLKKRSINKFKEDVESFALLVQETEKKLSKEINSESIEKIRKLDRTRETLIAARNRMTEADNWKTVTSELEALYAKKDYTKAGERLMTSSNSLESLSNSAEYQTRKDLLQTLTAEFIGLVKDAFRASLKDESIIELEKLVGLLENFDQKDAICKIYCEERGRNLVGAKSEGEKQTFKDLMGSIQAFITKEYAFMRTIFAKPDEYFSLILFSIIDNIDPKIGSIVGSVENLPSKQKYLNILNTFTICHQFSICIEDLVPAIDPKLESLLFKQFFTYQQKFADLERDYLSTTVKIGMAAEEIMSTLIKELNESYSRFQTFVGPKLANEWMQVVDFYSQNALDLINGSIAKSMESQNKSLGSEFIVPPDYQSNFDRAIKEFKLFVEFSAEFNQFWTNAKSSSAIDSKFSKMASSFIQQLSNSPLVHNPISLTKLETVVGKYQAFAVHTLVKPMAFVFENLPKQSVWTSNSTQTLETPLTSITGIGEHILTIPQYFDPYLQDPILAHSLPTLPFVDLQSLQDPEFDASYAWFESVVRTSEDCYLENILKIKKFTDSGRSQLLNDMTYMKNVMAALDIECKPLFSAFVKAAGLSKVDFQQEFTAENEFYTKVSILFEQ